MRASEIRTPHSALRNRDGFTIIEILLAIGILAIGITSVLFLFTMGTRSHQRALDRTRAAMLAETVANQLQTDFGPAYAVNNITNATHPDFPGYHYSVTFPPPLYGGTSYYRVSILVSWGDPNASDARNSQSYETVLQRKSF